MRVSFVVIAFLILFFSVSALARAGNSRAPAQDYRQAEQDYRSYFDLDDSEIVLVRSIDLNRDGVPELALASEESCGGVGCEYAIYAQPHRVPHWKRVAEFQGSFEVKDATKALPEGRYADIEVRSKGEPGDKNPTVELLRFNPTAQRYLRLP